MKEIARLALMEAVKEIGNGEIGANNAGPHVEKYLNGLAEPPSNWCAAFVSWCFSKACEEVPGRMPFAYNLVAKSIFNAFKHNDALDKKYSLSIEKDPEQGDLIFWWRGTKDGWMGHVGIIEEVTRKFIHTIEGNKGTFPSKVNRYYYNPNYIPQLLGYGRIN